MEIEPTEENVQDVDDWYRQEHLEMLAKLSGYRGGIRYVCMNGARTTAGGPPLYLAAHFVDHINSFSGTDYDALLETPWTLKHLKESKSAIMRFWDKVADYGH